VEVSFKSRLIKILPMLVERPKAFNKPMEKAEKMWGKNFNTKLPSHGMRKG
jgi:hypothetical protein